MKHGKKPTVAQSIIISNHTKDGQPLKPCEWLVVKNLPELLVIQHRACGAVEEVPKGGGQNGLLNPHGQAI